MAVTRTSKQITTENIYEEMVAIANKLRREIGKSSNASASPSLKEIKLNFLQSILRLHQSGQGHGLQNAAKIKIKETSDDVLSAVFAGIRSRVKKVIESLLGEKLTPEVIKNIKDNFNIPMLMPLLISTAPGAKNNSRPVPSAPTRSMVFAQNPLSHPVPSAPPVEMLTGSLSITQVSLLRHPPVVPQAAAASVNVIPSYLCCKKTGMLMSDPVVNLKDGLTYERSSLAAGIACVPNRAIADAIAWYQSGSQGEPEHLFCLISGECMTNPMIAIPSGYTYEEGKFAVGNVDSYTQSTIEQLIPNIALAGAIKDWANKSRFQVQR